ncbi:MAG: phospholipase D-like domain-containing protein [Deferribacteraceae bacterium]|jgi:phosphatidylserine/phosphatidylglycerophosphate/cardiolipin synthase-like enzyme|nr:phospholipase D-like domain-containing protein [Deferribacteraceae bacterium]
MIKLKAIWVFYKRHASIILFAALGLFVLISNLRASDRKVYEARTMLLADQELFPELAAAFSDAETEIACALYMFKTDGGRTAPTTVLLSALRAAAGRGVKVKLLLDIDKKGDLSTEFNTDTAKALKSSGAEIYFDDPARRLHTKMCIIDRKLSFIGSHNYTFSALQRNAEVTVRIESEGLAGEGLKYIDNLINNGGEVNAAAEGGADE